jgi:large subunit ribosomal protein L28
MARKCELSGVGPTTGNLVSHSNIKTRTKWFPNLSDKKYFIPELGLTVTLRLTSRAVRTIDKQGGITSAIKQSKDALISPRLKTLKNRILKAARSGSVKTTDSATKA